MPIHMAKFELGILQPIRPSTSSVDDRVEAEKHVPNDEIDCATRLDGTKDPLQWSNRVKGLILWSTALVAALVAASGPMVSTSYTLVSREYHQSTDHVVQMLSGNFSVAFGVGTVIASAFGVVYGRRAAFLISVLLMVSSSLWMALDNHFASLTVARMLQGFAAAPLEVLSTGLVSDLYHVDERGRALAIVGAMHFLSILLSQVVGGFVVQFLGWRYLFFGIALLMALMWPVVLMIPETISTRLISQIHGSVHGMGAEIVSDASADKTRSLYNFRFWNGRMSQVGFFSTCLRPFPLLCYPAVLFGIFVHGLGTTYLQAFGFVKLRIFSAAPYNLTTSQIGLTVIPGAIAGLVAQLFAGRISDYLVKKLTLRNKGQYEPEFRLLLMIPQTIFSLLGILGFGLSIGSGKPLWIVLNFYACVAFSAPFGSLASIGYLVDAMPTCNQEALVATMLVRSIMTLLFASSVNGWIDRFGTQTVFIAFGLFSFSISLLTMPFYVYGKILRQKVGDSRMLRKLDNVLR